MWFATRHIRCNVYDQFKSANSVDQFQADMDKLDRAIRRANEWPNPPVKVESIEVKPIDMGDIDSFLDGIHKDLIQRALNSVGGSVSLAAKVLGLNRTTLHHRMVMFNLH